jgi:hypothetical protein
VIEDVLSPILGPIAAVAILIGLALACFGRLIFKAAVMIIGFIVGALSIGALTYSIGASRDDPRTALVTIGFALLGGIGGALLAWGALMLLWFLSGAVPGGFLTFLVMKTHFHVEGAALFFSTASVAMLLGFFMVWLQLMLLAVTTAFWGSVLVGAGTYYFTGSTDAGIGLGVVTFLLGLGVQFGVLPKFLVKTAEPSQPSDSRQATVPSMPPTNTRTTPERSPNAVATRSAQIALPSMSPWQRFWVAWGAFTIGWLVLNVVLLKYGWEPITSLAAVLLCPTEAYILACRFPPPRLSSRPRAATTVIAAAVPSSLVLARFFSVVVAAWGYWTYWIYHPFQAIGTRPVTYAELTLGLVLAGCLIFWTMRSAKTLSNPSPQPNPPLDLVVTSPPDGTKHSAADNSVQQSTNLLDNFEKLRVAHMARPEQADTAIQVMNGVLSLNPSPFAGVARFANVRPGRIDATFTYRGESYKSACFWGKPLSKKAMDELRNLAREAIGQDQRGLALVISLNGWTPNLLEALKTNKQRNLVLMDGDDVRSFITGVATWDQVLDAKTNALRNGGVSFFSVRDLNRLSRQP